MIKTLPSRKYVLPSEPYQDSHDNHFIHKPPSCFLVLQILYTTKPTMSRKPVILDFLTGLPFTGFLPLIAWANSQVIWRAWFSPFAGATNENTLQRPGHNSRGHAGLSVGEISPAISNLSLLSTSSLFSLFIYSGCLPIKASW